MNRSSDPSFIGHWWMAGFVDVVTKQVAFVFYDQGLGIPATLRNKHSSRRIPFFKMPAPKMIKEAVLYGKSREESDRHGSGLPSLKEVIENSESNGFLRVMSGGGDFLFRKAGSHVSQDISNPLSGALISWSLHSDDVAKLGVMDLSEIAGEQFRLNI